MYKKRTSYILLHIAMIIYSSCSIASKLASYEKAFSFKYFIYIGFVLLILGIYAILWQQVLKNINLTVAFAYKGITIVWGMIIGFLIFKEKITINNIIGSFIILIGITLMQKVE